MISALLFRATGRSRATARTATSRWTPSRRAESSSSADRGRSSQSTRSITSRSIWRPAAPYLSCWVGNMEDFLSSLLARWGNTNWPPSMKVKKLEIFQNKRGLKGCKWSSLNAPGTENPLSHSLLGLEEYPFPISRFMVRTPKETKDKRRFAARNAVGIITAGKRFCVKVRNICVEIHQF